MNLALAVSEIVFPVFALAAIGFVWVRLGLEYQVEFVTRMSMTLGVPCLIFTALQGTAIAPAALTSLSLASITAYVLLAGIFTLLVWRARLERRTWLAPLVFGNTGNVGLPLALFAFGNEGLEFAIVVFAIMAILSFTYGVWLVSGAGDPRVALREPMVWATVLGALFMLADWELPKFATASLQLVGQMAIPLMLITLGVAVARIGAIHSRKVLLLAAVKFGICWGIGWTIQLVFALDQVAGAVLTLQLITPVAVTSYLLAEKYGADSEPVASLVVVSTLLSVAFLPVVLAFLLA